MNSNKPEINSPDTYKLKIENMKMSMQDKLFLEDIAEVSEDYKYVDLEGWEE
ncbi:hypothetical protein [Methanoplanus endosymbiosus]|jgi:hypothetical protein|uniref:Uncharacterized protein n=1 Tax=Methanoplanus endosymbiosus TaxID=33865 RepID=A0A9E7PLE8_9EURY|nr:hypothetical protein [Methanoplanus endosymbiosus]UUX92283.1 hypothetical protein L6E24_13205 [Methanoplanus endosymbiosus]